MHPYLIKGLSNGSKSVMCPKKCIGFALRHGPTKDVALQVLKKN
jgi:hypothetical protein